MNASPNPRSTGSCTLSSRLPRPQPARTRRRWVWAAGAALGVAVMANRRERARHAASLPAGPPPSPVHFTDLGATASKVETNDGASLHVVSAGPADGPTVVLSHCWMGNLELWSAVAQQLVADGHRVIAYDQRGHGSSSVGSADITIERLGDDLNSVLADLEVDDAVLVGHSMGGMAVQALAADHPETIKQMKGMVLVSTATKPSRIAAPAGLAHRVIGESASGRLKRRGPKALGRTFGPAADPGHLDTMHDAMLATAGKTRADCLVAISRMDYRHRLGQISAPTRVLVGSEDRLTPPARSRRITDLIRGAEMTFLDDIGHMIPLESPDAVVAAIGSLAPTSPDPWSQP